MRASRGSLSRSLRRNGLVLLLAVAPILAPLVAQAGQVGDPDLTATKFNNASPTLTVGEQFAWTISVRNSGGDPEFEQDEVILRDDLPSGPTYGEADIFFQSDITGTIDCNLNSDVLECVAFGGPVTFGSTGTFQVDFDVTPDTAGELDNPPSGGTCAVDPDDTIYEYEPNGPNNACSDSVEVAPAQPNLIATKTNDTSGAGATGVPFEWEIEITNEGPGDAVFGSGDVLLVDDLPDSGATYGTVDETSAAVECVIDGDETMTCSALSTVELEPTDSVVITFDVTPTAAGDLDNPRDTGQCKVEPNENITETNENDNGCTDSVTVVTSPDLSASKTNDDADSTVFVGDFFNWSVRVSNTGATANFNSGDEILVDDLPSGAVYGTPAVIGPFGITGTFTCIISGNVLRCNATSTLQLANPGSFTVRFSVQPTAPGFLINPPGNGGQCLVDSDNDVIESDETNNRCLNRVTVLADGPNLTVTKSHDPSDDEVDIGETFQWTIVVENIGNDDANFGSNEVVLRDDLPVGPNYFNLADDDATITCDITSDVLTCRTGAAPQAIPPGGSLTVTFDARSPASGTLSNPRAAGACVVDPGGEVIDEVDLQDNTCSDSVTVLTAGPDLTATKTNDATNSEVVAGGTFNWRIDVNNIGDEATNFLEDDVVLEDHLPPGPTYGVTQTFPILLSCGLGGVDLNVLSCTADGTIPMPIGPSGAYVVVSVSTTTADIGTLINPTGGVCTTDVDAVVAEVDDTNNGCTNSVTVTAATAPNLVSVKSNDTSDVVTAGDTFEWRVDVRNAGDEAATFAAGDTILVDALPLGPVYGTPTVGPSVNVTGTGVIDCDITTAVLECVADGGTVVIGTPGGFQVSFDVPTTAAMIGSLVNPALTDGCAADPDDVIDDESLETDNFCTNTVTVQAAGPDLRATKTNNTTDNEVSVGEQFRWIIEIKNFGDSAAVVPASSLILMDVLPAGPTYDFAGGAVDTSDVLGGVACVGGVSLLCSSDFVPTIIAPGGTITVSFPVTPTAGDVGTLTNPAGGNGVCAVDYLGLVLESNEINNTCSNSLEVVGQPDLTATKTNSTADDYTYVGQQFTWSVKIDNVGPVDAEFAVGDVVLHDDLPANATYSSPTSNKTGVACGIVGTTTKALRCTATAPIAIEANTGTFTGGVTVTPTAAGTLTNPRSSGVCRADSGGKVDESDETNNNCSDSVTTVPKVAITRGSCQFDMDDALANRQFRMIFTPYSSLSSHKLHSTNPGQMDLNAFYIGDGDQDVTITLPYPFVTQSSSPTDIFARVSLHTASGNPCYSPSGAKIGGDPDTVVLGGATYDQMGETKTVTVHVPETPDGFALIRMHLDYGLKGVLNSCTGSTGGTANCTMPTAHSISNNREYRFNVNSNINGTDSIYGINVFKKTPGIGGSSLVFSTGEPIVNTDVEILLAGKRVGLAKTDLDGWYLQAFKHKGKEATYTVKLLNYGISKQAVVKANKFVIVNFDVPGP